MSFTDEIHDPLFALIARKVESLREVTVCQKNHRGTLERMLETHPIYLLMNPAIRLTNQVPSIVQKLILLWADSTRQMEGDDTS